MNITISKATLADVDFIIETIIQAEKSGTNILSYCTLFDLTEDEVRILLKNVLVEEMGGCELSLSSFLVAKDGDNYAGAVGGWIEGENEDKCASAIIKANLLSYYMKKENLLRMRETLKIIDELQIERTNGTYQIEYAYVTPEYRGNGIVKILLLAHQDIARKSCLEMQIELSPNNISALVAYKKFGFCIKEEHVSTYADILNYLPDSKKLLMYKQINF